VNLKEIYNRRLKLELNHEEPSLNY